MYESPVADDEDAALGRSTPRAGSASPWPRPRPRRPAAPATARTNGPRVVRASRRPPSPSRRRRRGLDLRRDLGQIRAGPAQQSSALNDTRPPMRRRKRRLVQKFFADRGTHLAAMIAYFALLSFVPLTFLALSLLGAHRPGRRVELPRARDQAGAARRRRSRTSSASSTRCRTTRPRSGSSAARSCSGRRCRSSACSSPRSTSSTGGRTGPFLHGKGARARAAASARS